MKNIMTIVLSMVLLAFAVSGAFCAIEWKEFKSDHFIVYFQGDEKFAKDVGSAAETDYKRIASELGYPRYSEFWLWDKRVKIYIYPDQPAFLKATGQPAWSQGMADYKRKEISSFTWSKDFIESLLPHEMAHLIFRDFVGFKGEVPLWLDEGVAQWEEADKRQMMKDMAYDYYNRDSLITFKDMMAIDVRKVTDKTKVYMRSTITKTGERGVLFLSAQNLVQIFYLQSAALAGFLIEKYGSDRFAGFCRELRDGKALNDALRYAYPTQIENLSDLETKWLKHMAESRQGK